MLQLKAQKEKVMEMIQDLEVNGEQVSIENLDKFLQHEGVLVKIHCGRTRGSMELESLVSEDNKELKEFFKTYGKTGRFTFIPANYEREFKRVESKLRMAKNRMALGYEGSYMTIETYKTFKGLLSSAEKEYLELRDKVVQNWDNLLKEFSRSLDVAISQMQVANKEAVKNKIMKKIPSIEEYKNSFYLTTSLKAFPVTEKIYIDSEDLAEEVRKTAIEENMNMVVEAMGIVLNDMFSGLSKVYGSIEVANGGKIAGKTLGALTSAIKSARSKNIFNNKKIISLIDKMEALVVAIKNRDEEVLESCELLLAEIYGYANEINVSKLIDIKGIELERDDLLVMYGSY